MNTRPWAKRELLFVLAALSLLYSATATTAAITLFFFIAHLSYRGFATRWQLWPPIAVLAISALQVLFSVAFGESPIAAGLPTLPLPLPLPLPPAWLLYRAYQLIATLLVLASAAALYLLPVESINSPRGPFRQTLTRQFVQVARDAALSPLLRLSLPPKAALTARIYYPSPGIAESKREVPFSYMVHAPETVRGLGKFLDLRGPFLSHIAQFTVPLTALSDSELGADAVLPKGKMPVVFFSHGLGGIPCVYQTLLLELASFGYFVVAVEHADYSACVASVMPEGGGDREFIYYVPLAELRERFDDEARAHFAAHPEARHDPDASEKDLRDYYIRHTQARERAAQIKQAYDHFQQLNADPSSPLHGRLDFEHVSLVGHSFGAATVLEAVRAHPDLFSAVVTHDPWLFPVHRSMVKNGVHGTAFLILLSESWKKWEGLYNPLRELYTASERSDRVRFITLADTRHQNFSDFPSLAPVLTRLMKQAGQQDPKGALHLVNELTLSFLNQHRASPSELPWDNWFQVGHPMAIVEAPLDSAPRAADDSGVHNDYEQDEDQQTDVAT